MSHPIRLTWRAEEDLCEARDYYRREAPHVETDFEHEIASTLERIAEWPSMYQRVEGDVRRAVARRFPFSIYYQILSDWIEVIAILHQSRDPRTWKRRL